MKKIISLIALLIFTFQLKAQSYDFPPNAKSGKCYERCFDYDKKFEWKEIECSKIKDKLKADSITEQQNKINLEKYQDKLKKKGFNIDVSGIIDDKTINAHNIYLKYQSRIKIKKKCYYIFKNNEKYKSPIRIDCELLKACEIKNKIKIIQLQLKRLNYNVDATGCIDIKTIQAYDKENLKKYIKRKQKK